MNGFENHLSLTPAFELGLCNGWIFMMVFLLQWLAVLVLPGHIAARTGDPAELRQGRRAEIMSGLTQFFWIGATLYSIFLPLRPGTPWFTAGLLIFAGGLTLLVLATFSVARAEAGKPFTGGIYRFSRHPMYLSMIFVYTAVSVAAESWLFSIITLITIVLQRFQAVQEERFCLEKFGQAYREYMARTPRWIGVPQ
jgi:protein-S-isoprenylcysteine O-methyltransferase Ste14